MKAFSHHIAAELKTAIEKANAADAACATAMEAADAAWGVVHFCKAKFENQENWRLMMSKDEVIVSPRELWMQQAPSFNFELDQDQLLAHALEVGFVTKLNNTTELLVINPHYGE
jgi:hypothetical protein